MKYLDERIILTVPNLTITEDGLYRYDVAIRDEWDNPSFIGNCFIPKGATTRDVDITDIVKNEVDFYSDVDFQEEWQVRIQVNDEWFYSNAETVLPIYRYPNRKDRMETAIKLTDKDYYIPSLQGFDSEKKGEFLPRIPFVSTDKITYELWMDNGQMTTTPYLYSGVKKDLNNESYGIRKNSWSFADLWKGGEQTVNLSPVPTYDSTLIGGSIDNWSDYFSRDYRELYFNNLPIKMSQYKVLSPFNGVDDIDYTDITYTGDWGSRSGSFHVGTVNMIDGFKSSNYIDVYINADNGDDICNPYPSFNSNATTASYYIDFTITEKLNYPTYDWLTTTDGITAAPPNYYFENLKDGAYLVHLKDANGNNVMNLNMSGTETLTKIDVTGIRTITINDVVNDSVKATLTVVNTDAFDNELYDFKISLHTDSAGAYVGIYQSVWGGGILFGMKQSTTEPEVAKKVDTLRVQTSEKTYKQKGSAITVGVKDIADYVYFDEDRCENYDEISANDIILPFTVDDIKDNDDAKKGGFICAVLPQNLTGTIQWGRGLPDLLQYSFIKPYVYPLYYGFTGVLGADCEFLLTTYSNKVDDYMSQISVRFKDILKDKIVSSISIAFEGSVFRIMGLTYYDAEVVEPEGFDVAQIDQCPAHYYLQWRDRYGSMQMQPFGKTETYSEGFTRNEVKNYQDVRRLANVEIQPKWKVNSGWMKDNLYPYYESLFVSPWLKLYDANEDKAYDVIITDSEYTEKTYKNQGNSLFNLELTLEENKTQKLLY